MRTLIVLAAVLGASSLAAQTTESRTERFKRDCDRYSDRDLEHICEVREVKLAPGQRVVIDGRDNGGIHFVGWERNEVLVRAMVNAGAESRSDAQALAKEVRIETSGDRVYADGPRNRRYSQWHVTYEVMVPRKMNVEAITTNGGVSVEGVEGRMDLQAVNGSIRLTDVAGDVRAETSNGSVSAVLSGTTWRGNFLDLETTNGSVVLDIPRGYNAQLETGTVNGGMNIDFPVTVQGHIGRRISTKLGNGGPRIRAITTNGAVRIRETR